MLMFEVELMSADLRESYPLHFKLVWKLPSLTPSNIFWHLAELYIYPEYRYCADVKPGKSLPQFFHSFSVKSDFFMPEMSKMHFKNEIQCGFYWL